MFLLNMCITPATEVILKMELNGYVYNKDRSAESKVYWRCEERTCKGRVVIKDNNQVKMTTHTTHGPCKLEAKVQKSMARLKATSSSQSSLFPTFLTEFFPSPLLVECSTSFDVIRKMFNRRNAQ